MKKFLQGRFIPLDYQQIIYNQFEQCMQGTKIVSANTKEFIASHRDVICL